MASQLDKALATVAVMGYDRDKSSGQAASVALELSLEKIAQIAKRLGDPPMSAKAAGNPSLRDSWGRHWLGAVAEVLFQYGAAGTAAFWPRLDLPRDTYRDIIVERLIRFATLGVDREEILERLRRQMPLWDRGEVRDIVRAVFAYAPRDPRVIDTLRELKAVPIKDYEDTIAKFVHVRDDEPGTFGDVICELEHEIAVATEHAARRSNAVKPKEPLAEEQFASEFARAVIDRDFLKVHGMLAAHLSTTQTAEDLERLVKNNLKHSGWPDEFEVGWNDTTVAELRAMPDRHSLPDEVTDSNFRKWMCLKFVPEEGNDLACFDWWMTLIVENGQLKVGGYEILDPD